MKKSALALLLNFLCVAGAFAQTSPAPQIINQPEAKKDSPTKLVDLVGLKGQIAPQFVLPAMDGAEYNLEKLRGKIVVVNLWATFCPPCITEMPELNRLVEKFKGEKVVLLAPTPDDKSLLQGFLPKYRFDYQVLPNGFGVVEKYAPRRKSADPQKPGGFLMILPTHLVIDRTGVVTFHEWGFSEEMPAKLSGEIERLLRAGNAE